MKKICLLVFLSLITSLSAFSRPLSPDEALNRIKNRIPTRSGKLEFSNLKLFFTDKDTNGIETLYIFNDYLNNGFIILSADDNAYPVLGYSENNVIKFDDLPSNLSYWLATYTEQINYLRSKDNSNKEFAFSPAIPGLSEVSPLLKTKWNQGEPYNKFCFTLYSDGKSEQSVTGCVATAMAQIMDYFQYPKVGKGSISYTHPGSATYEMNFNDVTFDWDNMKNTYYPGTYTNTEADAVATLMKACGYSVKMDYGLGESGANGINISNALIDYFDYQNNITVETRKYWNYNDWVKLIHKNLSELGPIVYDGSALDGGHSFVCDGYDGNGYFHFNWGWGGMADGYYLLDALNPDEYGIGGVAGGYNLGQQIILGINPWKSLNTPYHLVQYGNLDGNISENYLTFKLKDTDMPGFEYLNPTPITIKFALGVQNISVTGSNTEIIEVSENGIECKQSSYFRIDEYYKPIDLNSLNLKSGDKYRIFLITTIEEDDDTYNSNILSVNGYYSSLDIEKNEDKYTIINNPGNLINVSDFEILTSPLYENLPVKFKAEFENNTDFQLTGNYSVVFFSQDNEKFYTLENYGITLDSMTTESTEWWSIDWYKEKDVEKITESTEFVVRLYDNWSGTYVEGIETTISILPTPEDNKYKATLTTNGTFENGVYVISGNTLEVNLMIEVEEGIFYHPVNIDIEVPLESGSYYSVMSQRFDDIPFVSKNNRTDLTMNIDFKDAVEEQEYWIQAWADGDTLGEYVPVKFILDNDYLENIYSNKNEIDIYTLTGIKILSTTDKEVLKSLSPGIYIINGKKIKL